MEILIAEDDEDILSLYKSFLETKGHHVVAVSDGEECLKIYRIESEHLVSDGKIEALPFDAVVLDHIMPKKDGISVAKEIVAINPKQRIIFISAYLQDALLESIKNLGVDEVLNKPFDLNHLITTLENGEIYEQLEDLKVDVATLKELNPSHAEIKAYLETLKQLKN